MAHGMRIRNNGNLVVIDQDYENLSLRSKSRVSQYSAKTGTEYRLEFTVDCTSGGVIAMRSLSDYTGVIWYTQISDSQKKITVGSYAAIIMDVYVFDRPVNALVKGRVGLRIRNPQTGAYAYDSRSRYMKILGYATAPDGAEAGTVVTFRGGSKTLAAIPIQHYRHDWHASFDTGSGPAIQEYGGDNLQMLCSGNDINIKIDEWTYRNGGTSSGTEDFVSGTGLVMFIDVTGM